MGLLAGCHSSSSSSGGASITVSGTVGGEGLEFIDVGGFASQGVGANGQFSSVSVFATSKFGACGWADQSNLSRANLTSFFMLIQNNGGTSPTPVTPGTYKLGFSTLNTDAGVNEQVNASLGSTDSSCMPVGFNGIQASQGTITLSSITKTQIAGSFDVSFYTMGDHLSGSFTAPVCTNVGAGMEAGACRP